MASFSGKVIALTGAASGMGLATAKALAARGALLSLADVQEAALTQAAADIQASHPGARVLTATVDVRDFAQVEAWIQRTVAELGPLDGAANLAGVINKSMGVTNLVETPMEEWDFVIGVNLTGVMHCMRAQLPHMKEGGSLVNAASVCGQFGRKNAAAYAASKHGVIGLTRAAAKEFGGKNIRVNAFAPGVVLTPMVAQSKKNTAGIEAPSDLMSTALARGAQPEEIPGLIMFLLGSESSFVTGAVYNIDGGWVC